MLKKLKSIILDDTFYIAILLLLVGVGSFGLGRVGQTAPSQPASISLTTLPQATSTPNNPPSTTSTSPVPSHSVVNSVPIVESKANFVVSKSGTKYHKLTCPGAKQIKDSNKIFFANEDEALASGYTRAANCKF